MKVLVTGANGQLGVDVVHACKANQMEVLPCGRSQLDVTDLEQVKSVVTAFMPDVIIHCAAYTAVDQAETETDKAFAVNAFGASYMAIAAEEVQAKLCLVSTDYVFDGMGTTPNREYDPVNPLSIYGKSKLAGEQLVQSLSSRYFIVRTSWLYGGHGNNFVKTMLRLAEEQTSLAVVSDQVGSPTYSADLAAFLLKLVKTERYGIYHASNTGTCSWYDFAKAIFEESGIPITVIPCTTEQFPRPAPRPQYSVMDHLAIRVNGFEDLPQWRDSLRRFLQTMK